jgi:hypothetical protein
LPLTLEQVILGFNLKKPARQSELMIEPENKKQVLRLTDVTITRPQNLEQALTLLAQEGVSAIAEGRMSLCKGACKPGQ